MPCAVFTKAALRRLDGFQCRCLRKILGIAPSYRSRISNLTVLGISGRQPLSQTLKQERMIYLGSVARRSSADPVRNFVFENDQLNLKPCSETKRRGRPRKAWTDEVWRDCVSVAGSIESLEHYFQATPAATAAWRSAVLGRQDRGYTGAELLRWVEAGARPSSHNDWQHDDERSAHRGRNTQEQAFPTDWVVQPTAHKRGETQDWAAEDRGEEDEDKQLSQPANQSAHPRHAQMKLSVSVSFCYPLC